MGRGEVLLDLWPRTRYQDLQQLGPWFDSHSLNPVFSTLTIMPSYLGYMK